MKKIVPALVLAPFAVFSTIVAAENGVVGFVPLALREPWGMQMLLDLTIAMFLIGSWIRRDARRHGIPALPYVLSLPLGSLAVLAYLVHRGLRGAPAARGVEATHPAQA
ncbi:MAG: hypothetical protein KF764_19930 [Labilithrix sp.]|nr:hypothetical protein [Labilithrix sp.]MBX3222816.1 hypothetical protein [Labilithrix sp.]